MRRIWTAAFYLGGGLYVVGMGGLAFPFWHSIGAMPIAVWAGCSVLGFLLSMGSLYVELQALRQSWNQR